MTKTSSDFSSLQVSKVVTRGLRLLNFLLSARDERAQILGVGGAMAATCAKISGSLIQSLQKASLAAETTGGGILHVGPLTQT